MPAVAFQKWLAPKILENEKPFTMRALRKDGRDPKMGDTLFMFTGMRTKQCKKFAEKPCRFAVNIKLLPSLIGIPGFLNLIRPDQLELFSKLDGFDNYAEFCEFHQIKPGMAVKEMRLIAWITRDELKQALNLMPANG